MTDTWVPHPRDVVVFVAGVGYLEPKPVSVMRSEGRECNRSRTICPENNPPLPPQRCHPESATADEGSAFCFSESPVLITNSNGV